MTLIQILQKIRAALYIKKEIDTKLSGKSDTDHNHDSAYLGINATATKATNNANGKELVDSIVKNISISGRTITVTKLDGTTYTLTTQDNNTTYSKLSEFTNDSGYITSEGSCNYATKAEQDSEGNVIADTYAKTSSVSGASDDEIDSLFV